MYERTLRSVFSTFEVSLKVAKTREKQSGHFKGHESRTTFNPSTPSLPPRGPPGVFVTFDVNFFDSNFQREITKNIRICV